MQEVGQLMEVSCLHLERCMVSFLGKNNKTRCFFCSDDRVVVQKGIKVAESYIIWSKVALSEVLELLKKLWTDLAMLT